MQGSFLRFYVHEGQRHRHDAVWEWLLIHANKLGIRGGSAFRAMKGFGRHHKLNEDKLLDFSGSAVIEIEFIVTDQEAQQLAMIPMAMIVSSVAVYPAVMNNPSGGLAVFLSLFPFTAPLMMFLRTALGRVPAWQILLSVSILAATTVALAWFAGRVYRVGILMYGKKPTIPEILRWVRYSPGKAVPAPAARQAS